MLLLFGTPIPPRPWLWTAIANTRRLFSAYDGSRLWPIIGRPSHHCLEPHLFGPTVGLWCFIAATILLHPKTLSVSTWPLKLSFEAMWLEVCVQILGSWYMALTNHDGSFCCSLVTATWDRLEPLTHPPHYMLLPHADHWLQATTVPCHPGSVWLLYSCASQSYNSEPLRPRYSCHGISTHVTSLVPQPQQVNLCTKIQLLW